jgi:hypothetical protein
MTQIILEGTWARIEDTARNGDNVIIHYLRSHIGWKPVVPYDRKWALRHEDEHDMARLAATACDTIDVLLRYQANINEAGALGETPLHVAGGLHRNYSSIFDHLIMRGANIKATTSNGHTVLHALVMGDRDADYTLVTRLIIQYRIHRYARDKEGNTFLHLLASQPVSSVHKWMSEVSKHYDRSDFENSQLRNKAGRTPLEEAWYMSDRNGEVTQRWIDHAFSEAEEKMKMAKSARSSETRRKFETR